jgi:hypothetical protein
LIGGSVHGIGSSVDLSFASADAIGDQPISDPPIGADLNE